MSNLDLDALADELSDFAPKAKSSGRSPREERIIAGFEDIQRLSTITVERLGMGKGWTFSNGCMRFDWTSYVRSGKRAHYFHR